MSSGFDVAIVGGGPAGISTALHLQQAAPHAKIVVFEKAQYPRDKICAGGVGGRAFKLLEKLGVEVASPRVPIEAIALRVGGETMVTRVPGCGAVVRRIEFDHAFAKAAITKGIDVRDGHAVTRIAATERGAELEVNGTTITARAIIGADGVAGVARRLCGFPRSALRAQVVELDTEDTPHDLPRDTVVFDFQTTALHGYAWDFPTQVAGKPLVCRGVYVLHDGKHDRQGGPLPFVRDYLAARGLDSERYKLKQFAEQGFEPGGPLAKPRVLLVGEAAGIDIATGEGIGQAIEYGAVAGPYLARALARDDFGFTDWSKAIDKHHLGWQMAIRHGAYRAFYGRRRPKIERAMPGLTGFFEVGVQDFAGVPMSKLAILRGTGQFLRAFARAKLS